MQLTNPYKGLFSYSSKDEEYFFGREKEAADMLEMIRNKQLGILYGESGSGKTSLIHAKLFPYLKRKYYFPIYIRLNFLSNVEPLTQLRQKMSAQLAEWDKDVPVFSENMTLVEFASQTSFFGGLVKPILFFDQFEELFTLGQKYVSPEAIDKFLTQVADVIELRIPARIEFSQQAPSNYTAPAQSNMDTARANVQNWVIVFSLRQDYIAQLDDLRFRIPSIIFNRYRIRKFNDEQAKEAILGPAKVFAKNVLSAPGGFTIIDDVTADEIIRQLKQNERAEYVDKNKSGPNYSIEIDPTILSLYCQQLFNDAPADACGLKKISVAQVKENPCNRIIEDYYNESLSSRKLKVASEKMLITPDGKRTLVLLDDFAARSRVSREAIEKLKEETGIYRTYGEGREMEIELAHDQIAKRALKSRKVREANRIKVITTVVSVFLLAFCVMAFIYIQQQAKLFNVNYLQNELNSVSEEKNQLRDELKVTMDTLNVVENRLRQVMYRNGDSESKLEFQVKAKDRQIENLQNQILKKESELKSLGQQNQQLRFANRALSDSLKVFNSDYKMQFNKRE